jgi:uncharacterized protein YutD
MLNGRETKRDQLRFRGSCNDAKASDETMYDVQVTSEQCLSWCSFPGAYHHFLLDRILPKKLHFY